MLRVLDRYVIRSVIPPLLMSLLVFTFILILPFLMELAEPLISKGAPASTVLSLMLTLVPQALAVTIPMALLVGLLVGLGRLSSDREWVALQACGVSIDRIVRPVLILGVIATAATGYVYIWAVPDANQASREISYNVVAQLAEGEIKPRVFFDHFPNRVLLVRDVPPGGRRVARRLPGRLHRPPEPGRVPRGPGPHDPRPRPAHGGTRPRRRHAAHEQGRDAAGLQRGPVPAARAEPRPGVGVPQERSGQGRPRDVHRRAQGADCDA